MKTVHRIATVILQPRLSIVLRMSTVTCPLRHAPLTTLFKSISAFARKDTDMENIPTELGYAQVDYGLKLFKPKFCGGYPIN